MAEGEFVVDERLIKAFKKAWAADKNDYDTNWTQEDKASCSAYWGVLYGDPAKMEEFKALEKANWDACGGERLDAEGFKKFKIKAKEYNDSKGLKSHEVDDATLQESYEAYNAVTQAHEGVSMEDWANGTQVIMHMDMAWRTGQLTENGKPALIYFEPHGRTAPIEALLAHAKVDYERIRLPQTDWPWVKASGMFDFPNIPTWRQDGEYFH